MNSNTRNKRVWGSPYSVRVRLCWSMRVSISQCQSILFLHSQRPRQSFVTRFAYGNKRSVSFFLKVWIPRVRQETKCLSAFAFPFWRIEIIIKRSSFNFQLENFCWRTNWSCKKQVCLIYRIIRNNFTARIWYNDRWEVTWIIRPVELLLACIQ